MTAQQLDDPQRGGKRRKWLSRRTLVIVTVIVIVIAFALTIVWILSSLRIIPSSWATILSIIVTVLGALFTLFQYLHVFFRSDRTEPHAYSTPQPLGSQTPTGPPHPSQIPQIIVQVPSPHLSPPQSPPPDKATYRGIVGFPPPVDSQKIQQREHLVKEVYTKLTQPDITAIALTGIAGAGKSTLAALVYQYAEEQRQTGNGPFAARPIWLMVNDSVTMVDLAGTLLDILDKPLPDFGDLSPHNQAAALFNAVNTTERPRLIILDQFEQLLDLRTGQTVENRPGIGEWLDVLNSQPCLCRVLLTTRFLPTGTRNYPLVRIQEYPVKGLEPAEGIDLLRKQGVEATEIELHTAVERCDGHAFALTLLASLLGNHNLNLSVLFSHPTYAQLWTGNIARKLLDYIYTQQLDSVQRWLLSAFSIYRESVPLDAVQTLMDSRIEIPNVLHALDVLLAQYLLQASGEGRYQLHPIVASYARSHLNEGDTQTKELALREAHARAAQYYVQWANTALSPQKQRRRIGDVRPLIEAIWQHCQAEQWQEAYNLIEREAIFPDLKRWGANDILLELYQLLLPLEKWQPERSQAAQIYNDLGRVYITLGKMNRAQECLEKSVDIYKEEGDRRGEGFALITLGRIYNVLGENEQARNYYEQALSILREVGDRRGEGMVLNNLGWLYVPLGQSERALNYCKEALSILEELGDLGGKGQALNNLGRIYNVLGQNEKALKHCKQALSILSEIGDRGGEGTALNALGTIYTDLGKKKQAQQCLEEALAIRREVGDRRGEATVLSYLGKVYADLGEKERALEYLKETLSIYKEVGDFRGEGWALNNLGWVYDNLGEKERALEHLTQALHIHKEVRDRWGEARALSNLGEVYADLENKERALANLEQALNIFRAIGNRRGESWTLNSLGKVYYLLGQKDQALGYFKQALLIRQEVDRKGEGRTLKNLGMVYDSLGNKEEALKCYEKVLHIHREIEDHEGKGNTLHNIGTLYFEQQRYDLALACFLLAKSIYEEVQSPLRDVPLKCIDALRKKIGDEQFSVLLRTVEPQSQQIVDQALDNGLQ